MKDDRSIQRPVASRFTPAEWRFVAGCVLAMIILTGLPYLYGYLIAPGDRVFMGVVTATPDIAQYMAWMKGFRAANLIDNHLTPEPNSAVFFNLLWWTLAKLSVALSLSPGIMLHLYRNASIIVFGVTLYWFTSLVLADRNRRKAAFLLAFFGGGLGWIWVVAKYALSLADAPFPRDIYVVESNSFLSMLGISHFTISASLILAVFGLFILACERHQWRFALLAGLAAVVLGWEHTYDLLLVYIVLGLFLLALFARDGFSWQRLLYLVIIGFVSCWAALYSVYITRAFSVWRDVLAQFENAGAWTPDPFHLLILLGLPFIVALLTFDGLVPLNSRTSGDLFVRIWFGANLFIAYLPFNFQIHYLNGWQVPIALLATAGFLDRMLPWLRERRLPMRVTASISQRSFERGLLGGALLVVCLVNIYLFAWQFTVLGRLPHDRYLYRDEVAALDWLAARTGPADIVLSAAEVGQYIPSRTEGKAFLAHWAMTKDLYEKQRMVRTFFAADTPDTERAAILQEYGVKYVLRGVAEQALGGYDPGTSAYMEPCFRSDQADVYCVRDEFLANRAQ